MQVSIDVLTHIQIDCMQVNEASDTFSTGVLLTVVYDQTEPDPWKTQCGESHLQSCCTCGAAPEWFQSVLRCMREPDPLRRPSAEMVLHAIEASQPIS